MLPGNQLDCMMENVLELEHASQDDYIQMIASQYGLESAGAIVLELTDDNVYRWEMVDGVPHLSSVASCDLCAWNPLTHGHSHHYHYTYASPWQVHYYDYPDPPE